MSKPSSIPEELIKIKANKIWMKRQREGRDGTPESDWEEARQYLEKHRWEVYWWKLGKTLNKLWKLIGKIGKGIKALWRLLSFPFKLLWKILTFPFWLLAEPLSRDFALEIVKTLGIGLTAFGLLFSVWEGLEDRRLTQEKLVTERFSKAVEQLGKDKTTVRIGGIYALERIAKDSPKDFWTIMEVLTSYVRENSSLPSELKKLPKNEQEREQRQKELENLTEVKIDVQTVLRVIRRRKDPKPNREEKIDLRFTNLSSANLSRANLEGAYLSSAYLEGANLYRAYLSSANLIRANLEGAYLSSANLYRAYLSSANLSRAYLYRAYLSSANLSRAYLSSAYLNSAYLSSANLEGAILSSANLYRANLNSANLNSANLSRAILSRANLEGAILSSANLYRANLNSANLNSANLNSAILSRANLEGAILSRANLSRANLNSANLRKTVLIETKNQTSKQIKSACFWSEAIYKGEWEWDSKTRTWVAKNEQAKQDNTNYIEELKKDKSSDPKEPPDCS